jgi:hypothetical protein
MTVRRTLTLVVVTGSLIGMSIAPALAGEVTGSGKKQDQNQGMSWCSFSGLNDRLAGEGPLEPRAQSYGIEVKLGLQDPRVANPGTFCNPNRTPLPPNPNRTK